MVHSALYSINLEKIVLEKTRFNAIKSSIMYFFKCNCSLRIQNMSFEPKIWTSIFNYVLPLEHCALHANTWKLLLLKTKSSPFLNVEIPRREYSFLKWNLRKYLTKIMIEIKRAGAGDNISSIYRTYFFEHIWK